MSTPVFHTSLRTGVTLHFSVDAHPAPQGKINVTQGKGGALHYGVSIPALPKVQADELTALASDLLERLPRAGNLEHVQAVYRILSTEFKRAAATAKEEA